ncbi:MAG: GAF domain-containing sensor histidine kinase [Planctomycetota bacterium]|nr:GAF domain-containing sensor histidine kinase [Planctomycetota bacterium]
MDSSGLALAFPTHFWLDQATAFAYVSPPLLELLPSIKLGDKLSDHFEITRPALSDVGFEELVKYSDSKVVLTSISRAGIALDGQVVQSSWKGDRFIVFVGRPAVSAMADLTTLEIPGNLYGPQDYYLDVLMTLEREQRMRGMLAQRAEKLQYESLVGTFAQRIWDSPDLDSLYGAIARLGAELLSLEYLVAYRSEGELLIEASSGGALADVDSSHSPITLRPSEGLPGQAFKAHEAFYIPDTSKESSVLGDDAQWHSEIAVPLVHQGKIYGVLSAKAKAVDGFVEHARHTLEKFARIAAAAICHYRQNLTFLSSLVERQTQLESRDLVLRASAHEVRTPLTQISSTIELLNRASDTLAKEEIMGYVESLDEPLSRLLKFSLAMLRQSSAQESESPSQEDISLSTFDLGSFVTRLARATARSHDRQDDLVFDFPEDVVTIESDSDALSQVITNILSNAFKYSDSGSTVKISLQSDVANLVLDIEDHGIGIPTKLIGAIFEPFMRHPGAVSRASGTGLGLSIARKQAKQLGVGISVSSIVGEGSCFSLAFPVAMRK